MNIYKSYYIWTIGCQMNKAESERLASCLENLGYRPTLNAEEADQIILNSCVVRQSAENRVVNKLHLVKAIKKLRPETRVALTGCLVGPDTADLQFKFPFIDYYLKPGDFPRWLGEYKPGNMLPASPQVASYVPIMQGCDNFCSYCIVPYRRGREKSRSIEEIICEVENLVQRGVKEVTLLGQNVDSYGHDLSGGQDLTDLLYRLNPIRGLLRIRFLTNHPKDMKSRLIDAVAELDKVCEQINLPIQSGDDELLAAMRRGYTVDRYRQLVGEIRNKVPGVSLSSDIIVGFPGETEEQFINTFNLLSEIRFDMVHVAAYSPRPDTLAAREMVDSVPFEIKKERLNKLERLQAIINGEINAQTLNKVVEVLVEGKHKGKWTGRTRGDKPVFFSGKDNYQSQLVNVKVNHTTPWSLGGDLYQI